MYGIAQSHHIIPTSGDPAKIRTSSGRGGLSDFAWPWKWKNDQLFSARRRCLCLLLAKPTVLHAEGESPAKPYPIWRSETNITPYKRKCSAQEKSRFRSPCVPGHYRRGKEGRALCKKARRLHAGGYRGRGVLCPDGQGKTHRGLEDWQGSNDRNIREERLFRRSFSGRPDSSHADLQPQ